MLLSNYEGKYRGDTVYTALWQSLNARSAVVFIHPGHPMIQTLTDVPGPIVDYPFDTTRNAVHMVFNGVLDRYPAVRIILPHAGGVVPFAVQRFCELRHAMDVSGPSPEELLRKFKQFYWDTALSSGSAEFGSLLELADHSRILFGSDFPYAPSSVASRFTEILDKETGLSADLLRAINAGNARDLLPHG